MSDETDRSGGSSPSDDEVVRRAIGGDVAARASVTARAGSSASVALVVMAALLEERPDQPDHLERAAALARSTRDRQVVAIARQHLAGDRDLVDALARDHLVDHPDSLLVAWVAAGATRPRRPGGS